MKTIEFKSNYGNFDYRMTAEVGDEVNAATTVLCLQGLANICYRVAGSSVDKALGVKERKGVVFSDADGERINAAVSKKLTEMLVKDATLVPLKLSFAVTGEHEWGAGADAPSKKAEELWTRVQGLVETPEELAAGMAKGAKFEKALAALGLAEDYTDETGIAACMKMVAAANAAARAAKAKAEAQTAALIGV